MPRRPDLAPEPGPAFASLDRRMPVTWATVISGRESCPIIASGGGEIRTHETLAGLPVFKTGAFDHSATPPIIVRQCIRPLVFRQNSVISGHFKRFW